jgi:sulfide dehydrogenase [flavocytochrome c] flavoprotein chain
MTDCTRRTLGCLIGAGCVAALGARVARTQAKARVVVVGGGVGGATAAKYLTLSARELEVTLVEPKARYTTCFFSNLYLAGLRSFASLTHGYEALARQYGIRIIQDSAVAIDPAAKTVSLEGGARLSYDRLIVAPGIAFKFEAIEGYDEAATQVLPHAWIAGPQTQLLRGQLEAMEDGGVFVLTAPPNPFRCPPGPYERASLIAAYFKRFKPRAKILILDAKDSFFEQDLFQDAWERHFPDMIEWLPAQFTGGIKAVDLKTRSIKTASDSFAAAVGNVIPPQVAGLLAQKGGLVDASGWCPVDPLTFESKQQPGIHVIGDAAMAGDMPKSAFAANSQAKRCAFAVAALITGSQVESPHLFNTCFTFLAPDDAVSDAISFKSGGGTIKMRREAARAADGWYDAFTHDVFG